MYVRRARRTGVIDACNRDNDSSNVAGGTDTGGRRCSVTDKERKSTPIPDDLRATGTNGVTVDGARRKPIEHATFAKRQTSMLFSMQGRTTERGLPTLPSPGCRLSSTWKLELPRRTPIQRLAGVVEVSRVSTRQLRTRNASLRVNRGCRAL